MRTGSHMFAHRELTGVFVSDEPLDINEGATGEELLAVSLDADLSEFEIHDQGSGYREWCVPAGILNKGSVRLVPQEEEDEIVWQLMKRRGLA